MTKIFLCRFVIRKFVQSGAPTAQWCPSTDRGEIKGTSIVQPDQRDREIEALEERLSRLRQANLSIDESLDFDAAMQGVLDSARSLTRARYGVMTPIDDEGQVQDFLSSGMTGEEAEQV